MRVFNRFLLKQCGLFCMPLTNSFFAAAIKMPSPRKPLVAFATALPNAAVNSQGCHYKVVSKKVRHKHVALGLPLYDPLNTGVKIIIYVDITCHEKCY